MIEFTLLHPRATMAHLGDLPHYLSANDPRPAAQQFNANYSFGGWDPFVGFAHKGNGVLTYPGDPPVRPIARAVLRDEDIYVYEHSWVAVFQKDGSFEVCRMD